MMSFTKLLNKPNSFVLIFFAAIILYGCSEKPEKTGYIARVNDSYLTAEELNTLVDTGSVSTFYKNEVIRNWINREVLFQEAVKDGILDENRYNELIEKSKKELAGSLLLERFSSGKPVKVGQTELLNYYNENKNDFKLTQNSFLLNIIHFNDETRAIELRALLLDSDWKKALNIFYNDSTIISSESNVFLKEQDIYSDKILRIVRRLNPLEISIVIAEREGYYTVVQVLGKYPKDSVPVFGVIKQTVEKRYAAVKHKEMIESYIKNLYSNYEIEVKN
jgi:hypothetical protein